MGGGVEWHCVLCDKHFYKSGLRKESALAITKINHVRSKSHQEKEREFQMRRAVKG